MKLTKIVFNGGVSGIFGESVSSLGTEPSQTGRQVAELEMTPLGLVVTTIAGKRHLVPMRDLGTGDLASAEETEPAKAPGPKAKAR